MNSTSLHHILSEDELQPSKPQPSFDHLFHTVDYPLFEISSFQNQIKLIQKDKFRFFVDILQEWNRKVNEKAIGSFNEKSKMLHGFIYSSLKNILVQNSKIMDLSLQCLYEWYTKNRKKQLVIKAKGLDMKRQSEQQWQIRNSYKSTLPHEINSYNRRLILDQTKNTRYLQYAPQTQHKANPKYHQTNHPPSHLFQHFVQTENATIRRNRENQETSILQKQWGLHRNKFLESQTKQFYTKQFTRNKLLTIKQIKDNQLGTGQEAIKHYRINTSMGERRFGSKEDNFSRTCYMKFADGEDCKLKTEGCEQFDLAATAKREVLNLECIDGVGLLRSPFEAKLKLKKKIR